MHVWQVEVPEWYVPGAVRAASPVTPRVGAAVQASAAATQEVLSVFDITHGDQLNSKLLDNCLSVRMCGRLGRFMHSQSTAIVGNIYWHATSSFALLLYSIKGQLHSDVCIYHI